MHGLANRRLALRAAKPNMQDCRIAIVSAFAVSVHSTQEAQAMPSILPVRAAHLLCLFALLLSACAHKAVAPETATLPSSRDKALRFGDIIVSAQPSEADLTAWRAEGVDRVFNLRTPAEMNDRARVPFDEALAAQGLGLGYHSRPIGGEEYPFTPEALEAFAQTMQAQPGKVLLHCASGTRAGWLYAAYAVKHLGQTPTEAMRALEPLGHWPLPIEQLTGIPLKLERAD